MNERIIQQMKEFRLHGMYRTFETSMRPNGTDTTYAIDEMIACLVQCEWNDRYNFRIERLTRLARFRYPAIIEAVDYRSSRQLDKNPGTTHW